MSVNLNFINISNSADVCPIQIKFMDYKLYMLATRIYAAKYTLCIQNTKHELNA
jgi:hypothetical protein